MSVAGPKLQRAARSGRCGFGGDVIKQRVARPGQGRSGGYRMLIAYRARSRSVFLFGFAKKELDNIDDDELQTLRDIAADWLRADETVIARAVQEGRIVEVPYGEEDEPVDQGAVGDGQRHARGRGDEQGDLQEDHLAPPQGRTEGGPRHGRANPVDAGPGEA
jgi:hypothetical protein